VDVGSTKRIICEHGFVAFPAADGHGPRFVGGHPMAGSEKSGLEAADPMLYQSALWVLCPPPDLPPERLQRVQAMIAAVGARTATLDPTLHDDAVARISHVPQLLASALSAWAGADARLTDAALTLAAGGFRDMTRLALSSWEVWRDIVATNRAPIADGLRELSERLRALAATTDDEPLRETFVDGRALRQRFHMPRKGILHDLTEFVVRLEDRPGALLSLFTPLAAAAINVQDLEILKVREGESGTILLGFGTPDEAGRARALLGAHGFATFDR
jgi:prephenate dehydrogenase